MKLSLPLRALSLLACLGESSIRIRYSYNSSLQYQEIVNAFQVALEEQNKGEALVLNVY